MKVAVTTLAFCVAALLTLGLVMLYSAGLYNKNLDKVGAHYFISQLTWCAFGLIACAAATFLDYRWLKKFVWPIFILALILLALVFVPHIGVNRNGASRWMGWNGRAFGQPSELAKVALILVLAWYVERHSRQMHTWSRGIVIPGIIISLILGLIFIEPDRGTTILLAVVSGSMLLIAGVRWLYIIPPVLADIAGLAVSLLFDPMRMKRIFSWLYLEENKTGVGWQAYNAMLALGSGGWFGLGLGNGQQKLGYVPENHTDFILSVIGEELGLIATLAVLIGFVLIVICGIYIAIRARDMFGTMLAAGITFLIGLQAFINIGVVTSALPNKGLALPFISYGGSNLMVMLGCVGILFSIARQARESELFKSKNPFAVEDLSTAPAA